MYRQQGNNDNKLCGRPPQYAPAPCKLTFDLLTLKVVSESRVKWATSVLCVIQYVFLGLSVLDLGQMNATDMQTDVGRASSLNAPTLRAGAYYTVCDVDGLPAARQTQRQGNTKVLVYAVSCWKPKDSGYKSYTVCQKLLHFMTLTSVTALP